MNIFFRSLRIPCPSFSETKANPGGAIHHHCIKTSMKKIQTTLIANEASSNSVEAVSLFQKSSFGEKLSNKITYSHYEVLFLTEQGKMEVKNFQNKSLKTASLLKKFTRQNKNFQKNYIVYKDLREKGYVVKTALKFGGTFRVYEKDQPKNKHSKWICYPTSENQKISWQEFAAKNRVAHSTKKNLLLAIVDDENQCSYYEITWTKP